MKKNSLILFLNIISLTLFCKQGYSQDFISDSIKLEERKFTLKQGFKVYKVNSLVFDNNNWLFISGKMNNVVEYRFLDNNQSLIQRFNGFSFDDIPLPETGLGKGFEIFLSKRSDGLIYVLFSNKQQSKLYLLNPKNLKFKEVETPLFEGNNKSRFQIYQQKKDTYALFYTPNKIVVYQLNNDLKFNKITAIKVNKKSHVNAFYKFKNSFAINDLSNGVLIYNNDGVLIKSLTNKEINSNTLMPNNPLQLHYWFVKEDKFYVHFYEISNLYRFDSSNNTLIKDVVVKKINTEYKYRVLNKVVQQDKKGNVAVQRIMNRKATIFNFSSTIDKPDYILPFQGKSFYAFTSRNFEEELIVANNGELTFLSISKPAIKTFLNNYSIRGVLQIADDEVLIAAENNGWFTLSLKSFKVKRYGVNFNNELLYPKFNKGFLKDKKGFWSSDNKGLIYVDFKTKLVTPHYHYPVTTLTQDANFIYYASNSAKKIARFDKKTNEHKTLFKVENHHFQKIVKHRNGNLYLATNLGLIEYNGIEATYYSINPKDDFLLTVNYNQSLGLLIGTRSGKIYQFNSKTKTFNLLYNDELNASIATILFDDAGKLWINTFGGTVAFNPKTKETTRFGMRDGMSYFEANRYSALKTKDGHFLVGTLKGLNYFHPDSLVKKTIKATLKLSSLNYYNKKKEKLITILSSEELEKLKTIVLPVSNRNLNLRFGLTEIFNNDDIEFRYRFNNKPWISLENNTNLNLLSIQSGKHTLEIEALDFSKNKIGTSIKVSIFVEDYFYNKWWFYIIVLAIILIILFLFISHKRKKELNFFLEKENNAIKKDLNLFAKQLINKTKEQEILNTEYKKLKLISVEQEDLEKLHELANSKILTPEDWENFKEKFNAAYPKYLISLKNKGYKFTPSEERFITLEKLGLQNDEIAKMLGVSVDTVRTSRYRLRKKLNAPNTISITEFLDSV